MGVRDPVGKLLIRRSFMQLTICSRRVLGSSENCISAGFTPEQSALANAMAIGPHWLLSTCWVTLRKIGWIRSWWSALDTGKGEWDQFRECSKDFEHLIDYHDAIAMMHQEIQLISLDSGLTLGFRHEQLNTNPTCTTIIFNSKSELLFRCMKIPVQRWIGVLFPLASCRIRIQEFLGTLHQTWNLIYYRRLIFHKDLHELNWK